MRPQMYDTTKTSQENIEDALRGVYDGKIRADNEENERKLDDELNKQGIEQAITDLDLMQISAEQTITDLDLRVMELEA